MLTRIRTAADYRRKGFRAAVATVAILFICSVTFTAFAAANAYVAVTVEDGEKSATISTKSTDAYEIAEQANMSVGANDELDLTAFVPGEGGTITINRAKVIKVEDNKSEQVAYYVGYGTLGEVFGEHGIMLSTDDAIPMSLDEEIADGMQITIKRAFTVEVTADGETTSVCMAQGTVEDAAEKAGVEIGENDIVSPKLSSQLTESASVTIKRVKFEERTETHTVNCKKVVISSADMYVDESVITQEGVNGKIELVYRDKYIDGEYDSTKLIEENTLIETVDEIKKVGTKKRLSLIEFKDGVEPISELKVPDDVKLDSNGLPVKYKDVVEAKATAYTGDPATASGRKPMPGHIAVDPNQFPYGTELYIVSTDGNYIYGYCIAADTGGFVQRGNADVDLYLPSEEMCYNWGNRAVRIYVL